MNDIRDEGAGRGRVNGGKVALGAGLVVIGVALLVEPLGAGDAWRFWPLLLVAVGVGKLVSPGADGRRAGLWELGIGGAFLLQNFRIAPLHQTWPIVFVLIGADIAADALHGRRNRHAR